MKNYFYTKNKELFDAMKNDIDELEAIKTDIVTTINLINKDWKFKFQYDKETNTIHQCVNGRVYKISVDYIGPSDYNAKQKGIDDLTIFDFWYNTRSIGGHLIFPTNRYKVNEQSKSINEIRSYRFKERIDYFLYELASWYKGENKVQASKNVLEGNRDWLLQFGDFSGYIKFFKLEDFVSEKNEVFDLSSFNDNTYEVITCHPNLDNTKAYYEALFAAYTNNYGDYIKGCVNAIKKRTERMGKQIL